MTDDEASRRPPQFPPPFASAWGDDEFGLWAEFSLTNGNKTVKQKLRWIEPGTFWMGSPEDEVGRNEDEGPRHLVTLTEGFWLADTVCTQALWVAVMGSNPSRFQADEQLPVESVSWDNVELFLRALEARLYDFEASLPTEAQWEYACRAGTETPFSFGENATPTEVNCDENRKRTVIVGSLPPNPWGLYEMNGNVQEWCADARRRYADEPAANPIGSGAQPATRGGGYGAAKWSRSASRWAAVAGFPYPFIGFRVCSSPRGLALRADASDASVMLAIFGS